MSYNGWSNYPTWNVNLWLSNDEGLYLHTLGLAEQNQGDGHNTARYGLARDIESFVRDNLAPDLEASFTSDLLGYALDKIDWYEIAEAWLEGIEE